MKETTFGEKLCGVSLYPGEDERVTELKSLYARVIDIMNEQREAWADARACSIAITEAQTAQMRAVKALFS